MRGRDFRTEMGLHTGTLQPHRPIALHRPRSPCHLLCNKYATVCRVSSVSELNHRAFLDITVLFQCQHHRK